MNPTGVDDVMFRGIPRQPGRGPRNFLTSFLVHVAAIGLSAALAPQFMLHAPTTHPAVTTLFAPPEIAPPPPKPLKPLPKPVPAPVASVTPLPSPIKPFQRPVETPVRAALPKIDDAPALPAFPRQDPVLPNPIQPAVVRSPVQTGLFGVNAPPQADPKLPAPAAAAAAGFDQHAAAGVPAPAAPANIRTGAFGIAAESRAPRSAPSNLGHTAFDARADVEKRASSDGVIRKSSFDEVKTAPAPAKPAASAAASVRPVEILDKPKPAYTAEARTQKIEGTVLLDVIFAASGEVRVLSVAQGLGHGLDENAIDAARRIRFHPATQAGMPVDQRVLLHVVFQITG